jgi:hypothetical protein
MKILIIGNARHGKDTLAEIFRDEFGMSFISSSEMSNDLFMYDLLKDKFGYKTKEECLQDRVNHRELWYSKIVEYNTPNKSRLAEDIISVYDCYVGMRDDEEYYTCIDKGLFDIVIWVDASKRLPKEDNNSNKLSMEDADIIITNNYTKDDFIHKALALGRILFLNEFIQE